MKAGISCLHMTNVFKLLLTLTVAISTAAAITVGGWVRDGQARGLAGPGLAGPGLGGPGFAGRGLDPYGRGSYMRFSRPIDSVGPGPDRRVQYPGAAGYAAGRRAGYNAAGAAVLPYLPDSCSIEDDNGVVYNCNGVYYQPYYQGTEVEYVPIAPPQ